MWVAVCSPFKKCRSMVPSKTETQVVTQLTLVSANPLRKWGIAGKPANLCKPTRSVPLFIFGFPFEAFCPFQPATSSLYAGGR